MCRAPQPQRCSPVCRPGRQSSPPPGSLTASLPPTPWGPQGPSGPSQSPGSRTQLRWCCCTLLPPKRKPCWPRSSRHRRPRQWAWAPPRYSAPRPPPHCPPEPRLWPPERRRGGRCGRSAPARPHGCTGPRPRAPEAGPPGWGSFCGHETALIHSLHADPCPSHPDY